MGNRVSWVGLGLVLSSLLGAGSAWAQAPAEPTTAAPAPDLVRLKNGGMLRGTIAESGGDSVTIVLLTGETRKIAAADVAYAGPAASAPGAAPPSAPPPGPPPPPPAATGSGGNQPFAVVHADEARIDFASEPAGSTLSRRSNTATFARAGYHGITAVGYDEICTAPCNASLPSGTHTFAVSKPDGDPIEADAVTLPAGSSTLHAKYNDNKGARIGLILVGVAAVIGGVALEISAIPSSGNPDESIDTTTLLGGAALQVGGVVTIALAHLARDTVELSVSPGVGAAPLPSAPSTKGASVAPRFLDQSQASAAVRDGFTGLHLTASF